MVLAAAVFVAAAAIKHRPKQGWAAVIAYTGVADGSAGGRSGPARRGAPLAIEINPVQVDASDPDARRWTISGRIRNNSGKIYGVPDLTVTVRNESGEVIATYRFSAPASLLDIGEVAEFSHKIPADTDEAKSFGVEFFK